MGSTIRFERVYSDEHMVEVLVDISKADISTSLSCYTQEDKLRELRSQCLAFVDNLTPFEWFIGSAEYSFFKIYLALLDRRGHVKADVQMINNKSEMEAFECTYRIQLDPSAVGDIGNKIEDLLIADGMSFSVSSE